MKMRQTAALVVSEVNMGYTLGNRKEREQELLRELDRITGILRTHGVEKVILFGSLARGEVGSTSDIDLLIVKDTEQGFSERTGEIYSLIQPRKAVDMFVYTPQEIEQLKKTSSFVRSVLSEGRVLYEKDS